MEIENQQTETTAIGYPVGYPERQQFRNQLSGYHAIQNEDREAFNTCPATLTNNTNTEEPNEFDELTTTKKIILFVIFVACVILYYVQIQYINDPDVPDISVQSMSMYPLNLSSHESATFCRLNLSVTHHNTGKRMAYDMVEIALLYDGKIVSSVNLNPFYQENDVQTFLDVNFTTSSLHMKDATRAVILKDWIENKSLNIEVDMQAIVRIDSKTNQEENGWMDIICDNVEILPMSNTFSRGILGEIRSCKVSLRED